MVKTTRSKKTLLGSKVYNKGKFDFLKKITKDFTSRRPLINRVENKRTFTERK